MSTKNTMIVSLLFIGLALAVSLAVYNQLPEQMASHWNINDEVDGFMSRFWGAFLMPALSLFMLGLFLLIPRVDPLKANVEKFRDDFNLFIVVIMAFLLYMHFITLLWNLGNQTFKMSSALFPAMGILFIFVGRMITKSKRNYFIGIRTPWTLSSDNVWDKTHMLGGRMFVVAGVLTLLTGFFGMAGMSVMIVAVLSAAFVPMIYSYILYQQETKAK